LPPAQGEDQARAIELMSGNRSYDLVTYGALCERLGANCIYRHRPVMVRRPDVVPVKALCVEPLPVNVKLVSDIYANLSYDAASVKVVHAAAADRRGHARFPDMQRKGLQTVGIGWNRGQPGSGEGKYGFTRWVQVQQITVDDLCRDEGLDAVDLLAVDTEGYDPMVIVGATNLLSRRRIRVLEFEYSKAGVWPLHHLRDLTTKLDGLGMECFVESTCGRTYRITRCWSGALRPENMHAVSNVVCALRSEWEVLGYLRDRAADTLAGVACPDPRGRYGYLVPDPPAPAPKTA